MAGAAKWALKGLDAEAKAVHITKTKEVEASIKLQYFDPIGESNKSFPAGLNLTFGDGQRRSHRYQAN